MVFFFVSCLAPNLAGDSVYPNNPTCTDISDSDIDEVGNSSEGGVPTVFELYDLNYSPSESESEGIIDVHVQEELIEIVHSNVALSCDMSSYIPEVFVEDYSITILYMPLEAERDCFYNVEFSMNRPVDIGTYTLVLMEDMTEFLNE